MIRTTGFRASEPIPPCCFVALGGGNYHLRVAGPTRFPVGISPDGSSGPPLGTASAETASMPRVAETGDPIGLYGVGDVCHIEAAAAIAVGDRLTSAADGRAVPVAGDSATPQFVGAIALEGGGSGERVRVLVMPHIEPPTTA